MRRHRHGKLLRLGIGASRHCPAISRPAYQLNQFQLDELPSLLPSFAGQTEVPALLEVARAFFFFYDGPRIPLGSRRWPR